MPPAAAAPGASAARRPQVELDAAAAAAAAATRPAPIDDDGDDDGDGDGGDAAWARPTPAWVPPEGGGGAPGEPAAPTWVLLASGSVAGAASRTATAPMDRVKTLLQASSGARRAHAHVHAPSPLAAVHASLTAGGGGGAVGGGGLRHATGMRDAVARILADGGVRGFWRGNSVNVLKVAPETAARFWAYERVKAALGADGAAPTLRQRALAGACAGAFAQSLIDPLELVKTRLALSSHGSPLECARAVVRGEGGPHRLYRGMGASLLGIMPFSAVDMAVFAALKDAHADARGGRPPSVPWLLLFGATSCMAGQLVTYPLQLARTRLQAQGMPGAPGGGTAYRGVVDAVAGAYADGGGVRGLYRGLGANTVKSVPSMAISYATFEATKRALLVDSSSAPRGAACRAHDVA
jgi:solute carrier family 25 phosphate transporter 23/24/25/41